jgi:hypothetical protein
MAQRRTPETKYFEKTLKQREELEEFAKHETEWAEDLLLWYRLKKQDIPDDEYRGVAFFINREYLQKPGSLTLCYLAYQDMMRELPPVTKETAGCLLAYRYKVYCAVLGKGGYGGFGI